MHEQTTAGGKTNIVETLLLSARFLLVPMYLGLIVAMAAYNYAFFIELVGMIRGIFYVENLREFLLMGTLNLLDAAMVGNLIVMVMIGSQSIFVKEIITDSDHMPRFLKGLTSGILKVKMGSSLVSVSSIHLLTAFINTNMPWDELLKKVLIHVMFIGAAYVFAVMEIKLHPPTPGESH